MQKNIAIQLISTSIKKGKKKFDPDLQASVTDSMKSRHETHESY